MRQRAKVRARSGAAQRFPLLDILGYGVTLAAVAFAITWIEARHTALLFPTELYIVVVALAFAALGIWIGTQLTAVPGTPPDRDAQLSAHGITRKEAAVLDLLAAGHSNKEIAREMGISPNTVKTNVARLYDKLGVNRRTQAMRRARDLSLIA